MKKNQHKVVLLLTCKDRVGLVSRITHFIFERGGNILDLDEHVETDTQLFSIRISWDMSQFSIPPSELRSAFQPLASEFNARWEIKNAQKKPKVALFVSKYDHCLRELLWRFSRGEYRIDIPLIISNHAHLKPISDEYAIPFHVFPINSENKAEQERKQIQLLKDHQIDTIVLARYMQILSSQFVDAYPSKIINIHHSFLPAFIGGNPYKQAYQRGVKIIGATSHYVTDDLDEGPIIEQDVIRITHKDSLKDLIRKGRDLERLVLARALAHHVDHRVVVEGRRTIVFE